MSRTENSLKNIRVTLFFQAATILVGFFTRKIFVQALTQEYLGLNGAFSNILSVLSLTELGIGSAITYSLYRPLAERDVGQIIPLMAFFRRVYRVIGLAVALLGCALSPLLPVLVKDLPDIPHLYLIYLLFVLDSSLSYFYVYKQSLIIADQRQYLTSACHHGLKILLRLTQALFLRLTRDYFVYLGLQIGATLLENAILSFLAGRRYPYLAAQAPARLSPEIRRDILRNTKAMIAHKIGGVVVFGTDSLLISLFAGAVPVGLYSNYLMVTGGLTSAYRQIFQSLTASVGNLGAAKEPELALPVFGRVSFAGAWLYGFSSVCLLVLLDPFIELWVGKEYLFSREIVELIVLNFYVTGMRESGHIFREAYGLYWYERYKPIAESIINLTVSAILAVPFGIRGIFAGTFISTMATCFWIEPLVLFKYALHSSAGPYFKNYAVNTLITLLTAAAVWQSCELLPGTGLPLFWAKAAVCAAVGNLGYLLAYRRREEFRYFAGLLVRGAAKIRSDAK